VAASAVDVLVSLLNRLRRPGEEVDVANSRARGPRLAVGYAWVMGRASDEQ